MTIPPRSPVTRGAASIPKAQAHLRGICDPKADADEPSMQILAAFALLVRWRAKGLISDPAATVAPVRGTFGEGRLLRHSASDRVRNRLQVADPIKAVSWRLARIDASASEDPMPQTWGKAAGPAYVSCCPRLPERTVAGCGFTGFWPERQARGVKGPATLISGITEWTLPHGAVSQTPSVAATIRYAGKLGAAQLTSLSATLTARVLAEIGLSIRKQPGSAICPEKAMPFEAVDGQGIGP
jgi:hypothetical protein